MAALVRISAHFRTILAAQVALQLVDRRRLRPPHDGERYGLVRVAAEAANFEIGVVRVESVTERWRRLRRTLEDKHALGPRLAGEPVSLSSRLAGPLCRDSDGGAVKPVAGFGAHGGKNAHRGAESQAASTWAGAPLGALNALHHHREGTSPPAVPSG